MPNVFPHLASSFEHYLTLERVHPSRTYNYRKRAVAGFPVIEVTQHGPKCSKGESWTYIATPLEAPVATLTDEQRLYVGAQTQDRMFRGDDQTEDNYHHGEMRAGNGGDNPVAFLRAGRRIAIHRISANALTAAVASFPKLAYLRPLLQQPRTPRKHVGYWFEQYLLFTEAKRWRWNTAPAEKAIGRILAQEAAR